MKTLLSMIVIIIFTGLVFAQDTPPPLEEPATENETQSQEPETVDVPPPPEARLGRIYFPRPFIHAGKEFPRGVYVVTLTTKDDHPYFNVYSRKDELLFEEMAVVLPYDAKNKNFKYRVRRAMLRGYEYFRIKVIQPDKLVMAYFKVKQPQQTETTTEEPAEETKAEKSEEETG